MLPRIATALLVFALIAPSAQATEAARRPLTVDDQYRARIVGEPRLSPDGAWVAYVVTTLDREADEARSALQLVSWEGGPPLALTQSAKGVRSPRFSPDGRYVSYVATPPGASAAQLLLLDRRGGEPRVLTHLTGELGEYAWSPDSRRIVLVVAHSDADPAKPGKSDAADPPPQPLVINAQHFKDDEDGYLASDRSHHLWLLDVASGEATALTSDPAWIDDLPTWSPDGASIAFVRSHERGQDPDGRNHLALVAAQAGADVRMLASPYAPNQQRLAFSPDGAVLAYVEGEEPRYNQYIQDRLCLIQLASGERRDLTGTLDRALVSYEFAADGRSVALLLDADGGNLPARLDLTSGAVTLLATTPTAISDLDSRGGRQVVLYADDQHPVEVAALEEGHTRVLTQENAALLAELNLGEVRALEFKSRDGTVIHGRLTLPPGAQPGQRLPTVVWLHGGPNWQDQATLDFTDDAFKRQLLAAQGFAVLGVNYRGSSGRGSAFRRAIAADWGHKDLQDVLAGVDLLVATGIADPQRLGIGGWSYGAILTDYAITRDRRFRAAVSGAGVGNPLATYGGDEYIAQYTYELGPPWRDTAVWLKLAEPLLHADRIHTPTLFMGGASDFNVPIAGGEQLYQALHTLGVPTQLVVYPGQHHGLTRPSFMKDRMQRISAWYTRYLAPVR